MDCMEPVSLLSPWDLPGRNTGVGSHFLLHVYVYVCVYIHPYVHTYVCVYIYIYTCMYVYSVVSLCSPIDCSPQTSLSMEFSRQECWSGSPLPNLGDWTLISYVSCTDRQILLTLVLGSPICVYIWYVRYIFHANFYYVIPTPQYAHIPQFIKKGKRAPSLHMPAWWQPKSLPSPEESSLPILPAASLPALLAGRMGQLVELQTPSHFSHCSFLLLFPQHTFWPHWLQCPFPFS